MANAVLRPVPRALLVGAAVLLLAVGTRAANEESAFRGGTLQVAPFDELYHARRIVQVALSPGTPLGFDPGRGIRGEFCPWPPLYDWAAGSLARATGGHEPEAVLARAAWFPVLLSGVAAALTAGLLAWRAGWGAGLSAGLVFALAPSLLAVGRVGAIDHHFLEGPLALAVAGAALLAGTARTLRAALAASLAVAASIDLALFVQPALLVVAGLVFAGLLLAEGPLSREAGAAAFAAAAAGVWIYRLLQPAGYPESQWYLGMPHAGLLLGAAAGCAAAATWRRRGGPGGALGSAIAGATAATLVSAAVPGVLPASLEGIRFLGGDPWLDAISEFRPLVFGPAGEPWRDLTLLGGGGLLVPFLLAAGRRRRPRLLVLAVVAGGLLLATLLRARFLSASVPLLAVAGGVAVAELARSGRQLAATAAAAVTVLPSLAGGLAFLRKPPPEVPASAAPYQAVAELLRRRGGEGRVLAPWSWGHLLHVVGGHPVVVDNFGTMPGRVRFETAVGVPLSTREERVAAWCRRTGTRYVVLENGAAAVRRAVALSGLPYGAFFTERRGPGPKDQPTRLLEATFWFRAVTRDGSENVTSPQGLFARVARIETDPESKSGSAPVVVWELRAPAGSARTDPGRPELTAGTTPGDRPKREGPPNVPEALPGSRSGDQALSAARPRGTE